MEKKQEGDLSHPSKPNEEVKQPAVSGNASQCILLFYSVRHGQVLHYIYQTHCQEVTQCKKL